MTAFLPGTMMSEDQIVEMSRRFVESLGRPDADETAAMLAPDAMFHCRIRSDSLPLKKEMSGREFCEELKPMMLTVFPDGVRHEVKSVLVSGNRSVVESECFGKTRDNRIYNNYFVFIIEFYDGLIVSVREYTDFLHTKEIVF